MDDNALWEEIQLADRYLISAMYSNSASKASEILKKLSLNSFESRKHLNSTEFKEIVEAAGMALIQATSEMGSLGSIFTTLEDHFGGIEFVPHYLFLPAVCLQVSAQLYYPAQLALESYLNGYSLTNGEESYTKTSEDFTLSLPGSIYEDLVEVLCVHILSRNDPKLSVRWLKKLDLSQSKRQEILQKIQPSLIANKNAVASSLTVDQPLLEVKTQNGDVQVKENSTKLAKVSSGMKILGHMLRIFFLQVQARIVSSDSALNIAGGTLTFIIIYALIRERQLFRRTVESGLKRVRRVLWDFWELAFGIQVNPLAAVQTIPNTRR